MKESEWISASSYRIIFSICLQTIRMCKLYTVKLSYRQSMCIRKIPTSTPKNIQVHLCCLSNLNASFRFACCANNSSRFLLPAIVRNEKKECVEKWRRQTISVWIFLVVWFDEFVAIFRGVSHANHECNEFAYLSTKYSYVYIQWQLLSDRLLTC